MAVWTDELKKEVVDLYAKGNPTAENSTELVKEIADELEQSPNGVRQVLVQAGVYVKKDATTSSSKTATKGKEEGTKRVSKESQVAALRAVIEAKGASVDDEILSKLTGKAAVYFTEVINTK